MTMINSRRTGNPRCSAHTRRRTRALLAGAVVVVVAMLLAGCGGSSSGSGVAQIKSSTTPSNAGGTSSAKPSALAFAQCMRSHGVSNYPDPSGAGGQTRIPQSSSPASEAAVRDCRALEPGGTAGPPAPSAAQVRAALAFARCMRAHGLSQFPDPWTTAPGDRAYLTMGRGRYFPALGEVQSPGFRQAAKACGVQLP